MSRIIGASSDLCKLLFRHRLTSSIESVSMITAPSVTDVKADATDARRFVIPIRNSPSAFRAIAPSLATPPRIRMPQRLINWWAWQAGRGSERAHRHAHPSIHPSGRHHQFLPLTLCYYHRRAPEEPPPPDPPRRKSTTTTTMSASRKLFQAGRSFLASASQRSSSAAILAAEGRTAALATLTNLGRKSLPTAYAYHKQGSHHHASSGWGAFAAAVPAAVYMLQDQEAHAAEMERTFIAIKPDGVQRGLISEIVSRFERKGFKLVAIKLIVPSKEFAQKHYHDLKERPFFNGLCDFLSSGPVLAMVWEGEGVIKYGRKLIGATDPQKSEPGTIRGDLAVVVARNIIHGSDGPETAKDEIALWFEPKELVSYTSNTEKWVYGQN